MSGADYIDPELRAGVRSARAKGIRCIKVEVKSKKRLQKEAKKKAEEAGEALQEDLPDGAELRLAIVVPDDPKQSSLEKKFVSCASSTLQEKAPCLLLFRTDGQENVEGCRWILLTWIPSASTEEDRAKYIRSRGTLTSLVDQPYFLHEVFARSKKDLAWSNISNHMAQHEIAKHPVIQQLCPTNEHQPAGPLSVSQQVDTLLQRLGRREDVCVRLQLVGAKAPIKWSGEPGNAAPNTLVLDGKLHECRGAVYFAKSALPTSVCYFAMLHSNILFFVSWCPDGPNKQRDVLRYLEEARCAVMRSVVLSYVKKVLSKTESPGRIVQISARDPTEVQDGILKATEEPAVARDKEKERVERPWPMPGMSADFPADWPSAAFPSSMPSTMLLQERLVPPWRGGGKAHTIGMGESVAAMGSSAGRSGAERGRRSIRYQH